MKAPLRSPRPAVLLTALVLTGLSSCHRGVGCPTNFGLNDFLGDVVGTVAGLLF